MESGGFRFPLAAPSAAEQLVSFVTPPHVLAGVLDSKRENSLSPSPSPPPPSPCRCRSEFNSKPSLLLIRKLVYTEENRNEIAQAAASASSRGGNTYRTHVCVNGCACVCLSCSLSHSSLCVALATR